MSCPRNVVKKNLIVSLHDFHGGSLSSLKHQIDWLNRLGVNRTTILAVPDYHGNGSLQPDGAEAKFLREMTQAGHEVALHGYYHLRKRNESDRIPGLRHYFFTRLYTANEAEFYDLRQNKAEELLSRGVRVLSDCGIYPRGFVAPGWLISPEALEAVWRSGFEWTCLAGEILGKEGFKEQTRSFCWSTRSAWRVPVSVIWNRLLFVKNSKSVTVRISLHPADLKYGSIRNQIQRILTFLIEKNYSPVSYGEHLAGQMRHEKKLRIDCLG